MPSLNLPNHKLGDIYLTYILSQEKIYVWFKLARFFHIFSCSVKIWHCAQGNKSLEIYNFEMFVELFQIPKPNSNDGQRVPYFTLPML